MNLLSRWDFSYLATVCQFETISFPISLQLGGVSCCFVVSLPSVDLQHHLRCSLLQYQKSQPMHRDTWCVCSRIGGFETLQQERIGGLRCVCSWSFPRWPGSFLFLSLWGMNTQENLPAQAVTAAKKKHLYRQILSLRPLSCLNWNSGCQFPLKPILSRYSPLSSFLFQNDCLQTEHDPNILLTLSSPPPPPPNSKIQLRKLLRESILKVLTRKKIFL